MQQLFLRFTGLTRAWLYVLWHVRNMMLRKTNLTKKFPQRVTEHLCRPSTAGHKHTFFYCKSGGKTLTDVAKPVHLVNVLLSHHKERHYLKALYRSSMQVLPRNSKTGNFAINCDVNCTESCDFIFYRSNPRRTLEMLESLSRLGSWSIESGVRRGSYKLHILGTAHSPRRVITLCVCFLEKKFVSSVHRALAKRKRREETILQETEHKILQVSFAAAWIGRGKNANQGWTH